MSEVAAFLSWWLMVSLIGLAAWPLLVGFLRWLPDKGYSLSKALGLLLTGYVLWVLGAFGFLTVSAGGAFFALLVVAGASIAVTTAQQRWDELTGWLRAHWRTVLVVELVFLVGFGVWAWVRALNPELVATEKPMEFAFLTSILETGTQPPRDPWLVGYAISYYYFGYIIVAMLTAMTSVMPSIAFNLGIALLFGLAVVTSFGVALNLLSWTAWRMQRDDDEAGDAPALLPHAASALIAPLLIVVSGNFNGLLEVLYHRGFDPSTWGIWRALAGIGLLPDNVWVWLNIKFTDVPPTVAGSGWVPERYLWWWQSSRILRDTDLAGTIIGLNPIDEFPFFSFLLADMHPHVLALPFVIAAVGVALALFLAVRDGELETPAWWLPLPWPWMLGLGLVLGGLSFLNTWDFPIYVFVTVAAYLIARGQATAWAEATERWVEAIALGIGITVIGVLLYLPWYVGFSSQAGGIAPNPVFTTRLPQFIVMFGPAFVLMLVWLVWTVFRRLGRPNWPVAGGMLAVVALAWLAFGLVGTSTLGLIVQVAAVVALIVLGVLLLRGSEQFNWQVGLVAGVGLLLALTLVMTALTVYIISRANAGDPDFAQALNSVLNGMPVGEALPLLFARRFGEGLWLSVLLSFVIGVAAGTAFSPTAIARQESPADDLLPFVLVLVTTGALLTIGPEFVYLRDTFGMRMNTVFKFYYQAWVMFGLAATFGLWQVLRLTRSTTWRAAASGLATVVLAAGLVYTVAGTYTKTEQFQGTTINPDNGERFATLDAMAYMRNSRAADYYAIQWINRNLPADAVIAEAVGGSYTEYARVSVHTGRPTVLGWPGHQLQWRGGYDESAGREGDVETLYSVRTWTEAQPILEKYGIDYVYVGGLEASKYGQTGLAKFDAFMDMIYDADGVRIYRKR